MYKNRIEYAIKYDDDSGIKRKVEFDDSCCEEAIIFHDETEYISFPTDDIDWLICCLIDIKNNIECGGRDIFFLTQKENE